MGNKHMQGPFGGYYKRPKHPYPGKNPPRRHLDGTFDDEERGAFFLGVRVELRSEWLRHARWDPEWSRLEVEFKDGFRCEIACDETLAEQFAHTISKGGWWHDRVMAEGRAVTPL